MADTIAHIAGLDAFAQKLRVLPDRIARNVLRGSVAAAAATVRDEIKLQAPEYQEDVPKGHPPAGTLKRSVILKQIRELSSLDRQVFYVTVRKGKKYRVQGKRGTLSQDAFYAAWVEYGHWAGGSRKGRTRKELRAMRQAGTVEGARFILPNPFMRRGWEISKTAAAQRMIAYLAERIPREIAAL